MPYETSLHNNFVWTTESNAREKSMYDISTLLLAVTGLNELAG